MDYLERAKLINKVIEDGHEIIDRMRLISKSSELEELKPITSVLEAIATTP